MDSEWRDGFVFVGNQLALDFVNTRPVIGGEAREFLPDESALRRWLIAAGLEPGKLRGGGDTTGMEALRDFRESLRETLAVVEGGGEVPLSFLKRLNRLLSDHPYVEQVQPGQAGLERLRRFEPRETGDVFAPLAWSVAMLLTGVDRSRIRKCANCVLHFLDTSKKGTRIWCSMSMCGNRAKVAAYARRKRSTRE